jgi:hypothetical protein
MGEVLIETEVLFYIPVTYVVCCRMFCVVKNCEKFDKNKNNNNDILHGVISYLRPDELV